MSRKFASFIKPNIISFTLFTIIKIVEKLYYVALPSLSLSLSLSLETKKQKSLVNSYSIIYDFDFDFECIIFVD